MAGPGRADNIVVDGVLTGRFFHRDAADFLESAGRLVTFDFTARDAVEEVARGRHVRIVVDIEKTAERPAAKASRTA